MAKRHESLISLSHDHHHGLALALRLRQGDTALLNDGWTHNRKAQSHIVRKFYDEELHLHFRLEEEVLFPAMVKSIPEAGAQVEQLIEQHRQMEALIQKLETDDRAMLDKLLINLGDVLDQHIRSEERVLFALYEERMPEDIKQQLGQEMSRRLEVLTALRDR